ncbi:MAG: Uncharacterised protein [Pseudidiomarina mangrovi]|nr:MAG: Uncharacterised protein [Pseudidiomarina mangrovi]
MRAFGGFTLISVALAAMLSATSAAEDSAATVAANAAGYRASFTCSALFNANKSLDQIQQHELTGIYPQLQPLVNDSTAVIDYTAKIVAVRYSDTMPPRFAVWRPQLGCVQLPVGADISAIEQLPLLAQAKPAPAADSGLPWQTRVEPNSSSGNAALDQVVAQAFSQHYGAGARTSAVLVATPEQILAEHYLDGFTPTTSQRTWSVAKSISASIIGVAVQQKLLTVQQPAGLANWSSALDPRQQITLEHLLHMASGLDSQVAGNRTDRVYLGGGLVSDTATEAALEAQPGARWKYANNDTMLVGRVLREQFASADAYLQFVFSQLINKLGMQHTFLETDWQGDLIISSQVWTTARDLARLGILHLQNGQWQGEQILPANWLAYVSTPAPVQPPRVNSAGRATPGYGAQWWLFDQGFPGLPSDTIAARGNRGQYLFVIPSRNLVIVRRGYDLAGEPPFREHEFAADVLNALDSVAQP